MHDRRRLAAAILTAALLTFHGTLAQPTEHTQEGYRLSRLVYENTLGEQGVTQFSPDADGRTGTAVWELANGTQRSLNTYQYNHRGLLVSAYREFSDSTRTLEVFLYDDQGRRVAERFYRSDNVRGEATYYYDAGGRRVRARYVHHKGWLDGDLVYRYDDSGVMRSAVILKDIDTVGSVVYLYDGAGNLAQETWDFAQGWKQYFRYEYVRTTCRLWTMSNPFVTNTCQYRVLKEEYQLNGTVGGTSRYEYSPEGCLCRKTYERSDGLSTVTEYFYDPERRLRRSVRKGSDGTESVFTYEFDSENRLVLRMQSAAGIPVATEAYRYDPRGLLEHAYFQNVDGWLSGDLIFAGDPTGKFERGRFVGINGAVAELSFVYDPHGCLSEILWQFASGTTQRYRFTYEKRGESAGG